MKHSNHSPSHPSPVSRKLRSDSKLAALSPGDQSLLLQKLETLSYQQTASWWQDTHGICVSLSNLSTFRSRHMESEALKQAYLQEPGPFPSALPISGSTHKLRTFHPTRPRPHRGGDVSSLRHAAGLEACACRPSPPLSPCAVLRSRFSNSLASWKLECF